MLNFELRIVNLEDDGKDATNARMILVFYVSGGFGLRVLKMAERMPQMHE